MERTNPNKHQIYVKVCPKRIAQQKLNVSGTTKTTSAEGRRWTTKPLRLGRQQTRLRHRKRHPRRKPPRHLKHRSRRQHLRQPHRSSSLSQQAACGARDRAGSISRRWTRVPKQRVAYVPAVAAPAAAPAAAPTGPATAAPKTPPRRLPLRVVASLCRRRFRRSARRLRSWRLSFIIVPLSAPTEEMHGSLKCCQARNCTSDHRTNAGREGACRLQGKASMKVLRCPALSPSLTASIVLRNA